MNRIAAFLTTVVLIFNYIFGFGTVTISGGFELVKTQKLNPFVSMYSAQGLCCDGEYFYCSGALTGINFTGLAKYDLDMNCLKVKSGCIPKEFTKKYGSNHIGGIDCAGGYIYAPVEGEGYLYNFILLYECETLKFTGIYYDLTSEHLTDGIPWCAVDRENGFLYTSMFDPVDEILQYDLNTMELIRAIPLSEQIHRIQGGSVYEGKLYLSFDCKDPGTREEVLCVSPENGKVESLFVREMPNYDNEAEDICVYPLPDGTLYHTVDYDKLISANVLHFKKAG
ncbi:MAG: hypothetical protein IJU45_06440 [Clostridia bacterium]|nr:hypothetical protein [Clostridia bacterium]